MSNALLAFIFKIDQKTFLTIQDDEGLFKTPIKLLSNVYDYLERHQAEFVQVIDQIEGRDSILFKLKELCRVEFQRPIIEILQGGAPINTVFLPAYEVSKKLLNESGTEIEMV